MAARGVVQAMILGAGAFVLGLVVGGVGPRAEVRALKDRVFELERARVRDPGGGRELTRLLTRGVGALAEDDGGERGKTGIASLGPPVDRVVDGSRSIGEPSDDREIDDDAPPAPTGIDALAAAKEALALRRTQAMAALEEDIAPDANQRAVIEAAVDEMNEELLAIAQDFVAATREHGEPGRREVLAASADVLDVLVRTEERFLAVMTPAQREMVRPDATDPTSFVDPAVVEVLFELRELRP